MHPDLAFALQLADAADAVSGRAYADGAFDVQHKPDGTVVTVADRAVEEAVLALLRRHRPDDGVLGEEVGPSGRTDRRWVLDGIDGTHNFSQGATDWGTMLAYVVDGEAQLGVLSSPARRRRWWAARGQGAWTAPMVDSVPGPPERLRVTTAAGSGARVGVIPSERFARGWVREALDAFPRRVDVGVPSICGLLTLVAGGELDAAVLLFGGVWDLAAGTVLVEEAGGRFCDLWAGRRLDTATAVFGNAHLADELLLAAATHRPAAPPDA